MCRQEVRANMVKEITVKMVCSLGVMALCHHFVTKATLCVGIKNKMDV